MTWLYSELLALNLCIVATLSQYLSEVFCRNQIKDNALVIFTYSTVQTHLFQEIV